MCCCYLIAVALAIIWPLFMQSKFDEINEEVEEHMREKSEGYGKRTAEGPTSEKEGEDHIDQLSTEEKYYSDYLYELELQREEAVEKMVAVLSSEPDLTRFGNQDGLSSELSRLWRDESNGGGSLITLQP